MARMDEFTLAYFETALWSSTDESDESGGEPLDANYDIEDFAPETSEKMIADCADFQERFGPLIEDDESPEIEKHGRWELAGHDFWLTRGGHGAGFWDGGWPKHGDELTKATEEYGEFNLYVGDDGLIHGSWYDRGVREGGARRPVVPRHHATPREAAVDAGHHVADFNTLDDLIEHAERELGATHVTVELVRGSGKAGRGTKIYFPRGAQYPYEEARVWREGRYWHAEGPGARAGIQQLPENAMTIEQYLTRGGQRRRQAAEVHTRTPVDPIAWYVDAHEGDPVIYTIGPYPSKRAAWDAIEQWPDLDWGDAYQGMDMGHAPAPEPPRAAEAQAREARRREPRDPRRSAHRRPKR